MRWKFISFGKLFQRLENSFISLDIIEFLFIVAVNNCSKNDYIWKNRKINKLWKAWICIQIIHSVVATLWLTGLTHRSKRMEPRMYKFCTGVTRQLCEWDLYNSGGGLHYSTGDIVPKTIRGYSGANTSQWPHECHGKYVFGLDAKDIRDQDKMREVMRSFGTRQKKKTRNNPNQHFRTSQRTTLTWFSLYTDNVAN